MASTAYARGSTRAPGYITSPAVGGVAGSYVVSLRESVTVTGPSAFSASSATEVATKGLSQNSIAASPIAPAAAAHRRTVRIAPGFGGVAARTPLTTSHSPTSSAVSSSSG